MSYFVTITKRDKKILTEEGPFDHIDPALHYLLENNYFFAPDTPRTNAYAAIDVSGLAHLCITTTTAGITHFPQNTYSIIIRRGDHFILAAQQETDGDTPH